MQPSKQRKEKMARVLVYLLTLITVVVVAGIFVGCNNDTNKNGTAQQTLTGPSPSPSPSAQPSPKPEPPVVGDTIIVIRDGSVELDFAPEYEDDLLHTKFTSKDVKLDYIDVEPASGPKTTCDLPDPKSKIRIDTGEDDQNDIHITGKTDRVELKFNRGVFKPTGCTYKFCHPDNHVWLVRIDKTTCRACNPADKCKVTLHTQPK